MKKTLDFWFDYSCPFAYLGSSQVERLATTMNALLTWKPMLLGGVFKANGTPQNLATTLHPSKAAHNLADMQRWAKLFQVSLSMPSGHPFRTVDALRATLATGCDPKVIHGFYRAYWVDGQNLAEEAVLRSVLRAAGHDDRAVMQRCSEASVKEDLRARTDEAIALGIFGAPSYIVNGEDLLWGQDRMNFVANLPWDALLPRIETPSTGKHALELFWDFSSPFAYLASTQAESLAARTGAELLWRPMLLGGLFREIGQVDVPLRSWSDAKRHYYLQDMFRWAAHLNVPFQFPSRFPTNSLKAMRIGLALPEERRDDYRKRTFAAYWADDRDIADDAVLADLIGNDASAVLERTREPNVKEALLQATKEAARRGVFGAPTWIVDGRDLYWGQDRIVLVERALQEGVL